MPQPTPEQITALEAKHKRIMIVRAAWQEAGEPVWTVVLRRPTRPEYKRARAELGDPELKADATERLFRQVCVLPEGSDIDALLDEWPAIPEACSDTLLKMLGASAAKDAK